MTKTLSLLAVLAGLSTPSIALACEKHKAAAEQRAEIPTQTSGGEHHTSGASGAKVPHAHGPAAKEVSLTVTEKGFEPAEVRLKSGQPVTLLVTRTTDRTCANEIVIESADVKGGKKIEAKLPLNETVKVTFTPAKSGQLKYGCAMQKMIGGVLTIE